ncbi:MAG: exodeoxyribonuclease III [Candidatus Limnocylindria bacterium]|jgi:exodeoxyribonuclease-3
MRIATWNVNSLKVRLAQVLEFAGSARPDVIALQETKLTDDKFPLAEIEAAGYRAVFSGQKTYNGVALLAREAPSDVATELPGAPDPQRRWLAATCAGVRIVDVYVPNGESVDSPKYAYKLAWMERMRESLAAELARHPQLVVLGDFNVAPEPRDVHDPKEWEGKVLFSGPEREALGRVVALGLHDVFRRFEQPEKEFSWWDYRMNAFKRNRGLRIDLILASDALAARCTACRIDKEPRRQERPSDHTPVIADFA